MTIILLIIILLHIPNVFLRIKTTSSFNNITNQTQTTKTCSAGSINMDTVIDLIRIFVRAIIPFMLIIVINTLLVYNLIKCKAKFKTISLKKEYTFALSVAALNVMFIISLLPFVFTVVILKVMNQLNMIATKTYIIVNFTYAVGLFTFGSYNYCFQFLVNLKFNSIFRHELINWLKEIKLLHRRN